MKTLRFHVPYQANPGARLTLEVDLPTPEPGTDEYRRLWAPGHLLAQWLYDHLTSGALDALVERINYLQARASSGCPSCGAGACLGGEEVPRG